MKIFEFLTIAWLCLGLFGGFCAADELTLRGERGQRLSGVVRSIDESGVVDLESPLAEKPLRLKPDALQQIEFSDQNGEAGRHEMLLVLSNGDQLPIAVHSFSPEKGLIGEVPAMGMVSLPRTRLRSLEFGVESQRVTYDGPDSPSLWKELSTSVQIDQVRHEGGAWRVPGSVEAQRKVEFPHDFVLKFRLEWAKGSQPNFRVFFAGSDAPLSQASDRYYLQFASAGFEIKRESTGEQRFPSILRSNRLPGSFASRDVEVEIHVSRSDRIVSLYLNGELEDKGMDPVAVPPNGEFLVLDFDGQGKVYQTLSGLNIRELDNMRRRHRAEHPGEAEQDGLISRANDRWSGTLQSIRKTGDGVELEFDSSLSEEPLELLADEVSTVIFRSTGPPEEVAPGAFRIRFLGEGSLAVKSCRMSGEKVMASHPLLGEITLPKACIQQVERIKPAEKPGNSDS